MIGHSVVICGARDPLGILVFTAHTDDGCNL